MSKAASSDGVPTAASLGIDEPSASPAARRARPMAEQQSMAARATSAIAERGVTRNAAFVIRQVAARLEQVSSVAAIVGN